MKLLSLAILSSLMLYGCTKSKSKKFESSESFKGRLSPEVGSPAPASVAAPQNSPSSEIPSNPSAASVPIVQEPEKSINEKQNKNKVTTAPKMKKEISSKTDLDRWNQIVNQRLSKEAHENNKKGHKISAGALPEDTIQQTLARAQVQFAKENGISNQLIQPIQQNSNLPISSGVRIGLSKGGLVSRPTSVSFRVNAQPQAGNQSPNVETAIQEQSDARSIEARRQAAGFNPKFYKASSVANARDQEVASADSKAANGGSQNTSSSNASGGSVSSDSNTSGNSNSQSSTSTTAAAAAAEAERVAQAKAQEEAAKAAQLKAQEEAVRAAQQANEIAQRAAQSQIQQAIDAARSAQVR